MKKIPTIFVRDFAGNPKFVTRDPHPDCAWVFAGEGAATVKLDGACCAIIDGRFVKRREVRRGAAAPSDFVLIDQDDETGKSVGWVPVGDGPGDKWFREAYERQENHKGGTYELVGPKVQGNPEKWGWHELVPHGLLAFTDEPPRDFDGLKNWLRDQPSEGIVWHHPDGRMAKIKLRDFGWKRGS